MTTKKNTTNGFVQDMMRIHTITDRTHKSSIQYYLTKFVKDINWNSNQKELRIAEIVAMQEEIVEKARNGEQIDNDALLKNENDIEWLQKQVDFNDEMVTYFTQVSQQLFPDEHNKSQQVADKTADILSKYA